MSTANDYRIKAAVLAAEARDEMHASSRGDLMRLSRWYLRLAEQADRNSRLDLWYETPSQAGQRRAATG
jgi:hypothetical protein